jgi:tyrosine-protein phosphatase SIW14
MHVNCLTQHATDGPRAVAALSSSRMDAAASIPSSSTTPAPSPANAAITAAAATPSAQPSFYIIPIPASQPPQDPSAVPTLLIPPLSFSLVCSGVYRSAAPSPRNFAFLANLGLKSIIYLCADAYPAVSLAHFSAAGVDVRCFPVVTNREPFLSVDAEQLQQALIFALDARHQPVLVHCSKGKHRTGCFVGCLRRLAGHSLASTFAEYRQFLGKFHTVRAVQSVTLHLLYPP